MSRSSALFNPAAESAGNPIDITTFKSMVAAHFSYLMHHHRYLTRIEKGENDNNEEIDEYLNSVVGMPYDHSIFSRMECIKRIHTQLNSKIELFKTIYLLTLEEPSEVNLLTLMFIFDMALKSEGCCLKMAQKHKKATTETYIDQALNNSDQLRDLRSTLRLLIPEGYAQIEPAISFKEVVNQVIRIKHTSLDEIQASIDIHFDWSKLLDRYHKALNENFSVSDVTIELFAIVKKLKQLKLEFCGQGKTPKKPATETPDHYQILAMQIKGRITIALEALALLEQYKSIVEELEKPGSSTRKLFWLKSDMAKIKNRN